MSSADAVAVLSVNGHEGNIQFRRICGEKRSIYMDKNTTKAQKNALALDIVMRIRNMSPPGRFLKQNSTTKEWYDIGSDAAMRKIGQAIREHQISKSRATIREQRFKESWKTLGNASSDDLFDGPLYPGYRKLEFVFDKEEKGSLALTPDFLDTPNKARNEDQHSFDEIFDDNWNTPLSLEDRIDETIDTLSDETDETSTLLREEFLSFEEDKWKVLDFIEENQYPTRKSSFLSKEPLAREDSMTIKQRWSSASQATMLSRQTLMSSLANASSFQSAGLDSSACFRGHLM